MWTDAAWNTIDNMKEPTIWDDWVIDRNVLINKAYAKMFLKNPQVYLWPGMASYASSKVGGSMKLVENLRDLLKWTPAAKAVEQAVCWSMDLPDAADVWNMLMVGNEKIFADIYWQWIAFDEGRYEELQCILHDRSPDMWESVGLDMMDLESLEYSTKGWYEVYTGMQQTPINAELIWEGNLKLLHHEQHSAQAWFYGDLEQKLGNLCNLIDDLHDSDKAVEKYLGHIGASLLSNPIPGGADLFKSCKGKKNIANFPNRWEWITGSNDCSVAPMGPTWKRLVQQDTSRAISDMNMCLKTGYAI